MIFEGKKINILLIEDEDYDVRRVLNTIKPFENKNKSSGYSFKRIWLHWNCLKVKKENLM